MQLDKYHLIGQPLEGFANQQVAGYSAVLTNGTAVTPVFNCSIACDTKKEACGGAQEVYVSLTTRGGPVTPASILVAAGFDASGDPLTDPVEPNFNPVAVALAGGGFAVIFERRQTFTTPPGIEDTIHAAFFDSSGTLTGRTVLTTVAAGPETAGQFGALAVPLANGGFAMAYNFWSSETVDSGTFGTAVMEVSAPGRRRITWW